jgi:hypothetical protein
MVAGLRGHDRLLDAGQQLLGLGQRQAQAGDVAKVAGTAELQHVDAARPTVGPHLDQPQHQAHPQSPSQQRPGRSHRSRPHPPISGHFQFGPVANSVYYCKLF